ncbi:hypothetical protein HCC18_16720 [Listeria booriae]|uniref:hypothetical protein n=1 Tax=Listeria booriae TaxID=1552123 RepID=UPI0016280DA3|nr:hypothetical protein [Listeria booriae]MBC2318490.1 hypothetical protein [Listeria booriae]MCD2205571.1 hypothetical protein [Listeria booriae]
MDKDVEKGWFRMFCSEEEVDRILQPKNAYDYLLSKRAEIIADHARYTRVFRRKAMLSDNWSLEKSFKKNHYKDYLISLPVVDSERCQSIAYGDMFTNEVNGFAESNKTWGRIIYLNESLPFFMKFCNLAIFDFGNQVPHYVKKNTLRIAARIILKSEAMDFSLDPRGILPAHIMNKIINPIKFEMQFIAGHEFAHHLCNHFDNTNVSKQSFLTIGENDYSAHIYTPSQKNEFEADIDSIMRPRYNGKEYSKIYEAAIIWFLSLDIADAIQEVTNPIPAYKKSHPNAVDRIKNIVENTKKPKNLNAKMLSRIQSNTEKMKEFLMEDLSLYMDDYEKYGSIYFDKPNTEWRGAELVDRVDY